MAARGEHKDEVEQIGWRAPAHGKPVQLRAASPNETVLSVGELTQDFMDGYAVLVAPRPACLFRVSVKASVVFMAPAGKEAECHVAVGFTTDMDDLSRARALHPNGSLTDGAGSNPVDPAVEGRQFALTDRIDVVVVTADGNEDNPPSLRWGEGKGARKVEFNAAPATGMYLFVALRGPKGLCARLSMTVTTPAALSSPVQSRVDDDMKEAMERVTSKCKEVWHELLGADAEGNAWSVALPVRALVLGLQGAGKTSALLMLAGAWRRQANGQRDKNPDDLVVGAAPSSLTTRFRDYTLERSARSGRISGKRAPLMLEDFWGARPDDKGISKYLALLSMILKGQVDRSLNSDAFSATDDPLAVQTRYSSSVKPAVSSFPAVVLVLVSGEPWKSGGQPQSARDDPLSFVRETVKRVMEPNMRVPYAGETYALGDRRPCVLVITKADLLDDGAILRGERGPELLRAMDDVSRMANKMAPVLPLASNDMNNLDDVRVTRDWLAMAVLGEAMSRAAAWFRDLEHERSKLWEDAVAAAAAAPAAAGSDAANADDA